ncbi:MAG: hypothetical protein VKK42_10865 [Lyngbya sp.]|nr:hypothetical protein [Lyngbya sp.]
MWEISVSSIKNALSKALESLSDWKELNYFQKGQVIDNTFKSILKDLMNQFGMEPGIDYVDNLKPNEPCTDFVALSPRADELITGLMEGKIIAISGYIRTSKLGNQSSVKAHFRRKAS